MPDVPPPRARVLGRARDSPPEGAGSHPLGERACSSPAERVGRGDPPPLVAPRLGWRL